MKKLYFVILQLIFFVLSPTAFAQDAPCSPIQNKICSQTAYDTCTPTCEGSKAAYYCYQASNPNCNGTILCAPEDSRCKTTQTNECITNSTKCKQATYDTCNPICTEDNKAAYFCYRQDNPNCKGTILCSPEDSRCKTPILPTPTPTSSPKITPTPTPTSTPKSTASPLPTTKPTPIPLTVTGLTINGQEVAPQIGNQVKLSLPVADLTKEASSIVPILVRYSNGTNRNFFLNFHYQPAQPSSSITHITSCQEITKPGNYVLDQDIINTEKYSFCFLIRGISDVNIECNNHSILNGGILVQEGNNIRLKACNFVVDSLDDSSLIAFNKVNTGSLTSSILQNHSVNITESNDVRISNNQFNTGTILNYKSHNTEINNNKFTVSVDSKRFKSRSLGAYITSEIGSNNKIVNNVMDGKSDGMLNNKLGFDDGIILGTERDISIGENQNLIQNNTISNVYDCGIEGAGLVQNNTISNNRIDNTGYCGIGAWYSSSWQGNIVSDNIVNNSPSLLTFFFSTRKSGAKQSKAYFSDNNFKNNKLTNQKVAREKTGFNFEPFSTFIDYYTLHYDADDPNNTELIKYNNTFSGNDLELQTAPYFVPGSMIVDGGNNICLQGKERDSPLKCVGTPTDNAVNRVQSLSTQELIRKTNNTTETILSITEDYEEKLPVIEPTLPEVNPPPPRPSLYDLNSDGSINAFDAAQFLQDWRTGTNLRDFNNDQTTNSIDYALLKKNF